jgi:hypothetical protein
MCPAAVSFKDSLATGSPMIEQITIKNFKSFKDVSVKLGPMNIFIGPNASGKSNFFDALRVLQGIGYGFTLSEISTANPKAPQAKSGKASAVEVQASDLRSKMETCQHRSRWLEGFRVRVTAILGSRLPCCPKTRTLVWRVYLSPERLSMGPDKGDCSRVWNTLRRATERGAVRPTSMRTVRC